MVGRMNGWMDGWTDGRMDGWMNGWMDGWIDGWTDGWMIIITSTIIITRTTHHLKSVGGDVVDGGADVHAVAVVGVRPDEDWTGLNVEGKVGNINVTSGPEYSSRLPVQLPSVAEEDPYPIKVRHQLFGPGRRSKFIRGRVIW